MEREAGMQPSSLMQMYVFFQISFGDYFLPVDIYDLSHIPAYVR